MRWKKSQLLLAIAAHTRAHTPTEPTTHTCTESVHWRKPPGRTHTHLLTQQAGSALPVAQEASDSS